jgi:hypothetical protein
MLAETYAEHGATQEGLSDCRGTGSVARSRRESLRRWDLGAH